MDTFEQKKQDGVKHYLANKEHKGNSNINSRSVFWYGKNNKCRGLRRKADRHSHHRRRKMMKEDIVKTGGQHMPKSTSTLQHHNSVVGSSCKAIYCGGVPKEGRYYITNRKINQSNLVTFTEDDWTRSCP